MACCQPHQNGAAEWAQRRVHLQFAGSVHPPAIAPTARGDHGHSRRSPVHVSCTDCDARSPAGPPGVRPLLPYGCADRPGSAAALDRRDLSGAEEATVSLQLR